MISIGGNNVRIIDDSFDVAQRLFSKPTSNVCPWRRCQFLEDCGSLCFRSKVANISKVRKITMRRQRARL